MSEFVFDIVFLRYQDGLWNGCWQPTTWQLKWFADLVGYHVWLLFYNNLPSIDGRLTGADSLHCLIAGYFGAPVSSVPSTLVKVGIQC